MEGFRKETVHQEPDMPNHLAMDKVQTIQHLAQSGWSQRRISEAVGVDRKSIRRLLGSPSSKGTTESDKAPTGLESDSESSKGTTVDVEAPTAPEVCDSPADSTESAPAPPASRSSCRKFHEPIVQGLQTQLTSQRIYQDLKTDHGYTGSYWALNRYINRLEQKKALPFRRIETPPGQEVQVDFGKGAPYIDRDGKKRRCHVLRVVLSHSRKAYSEVVARQTTDNFVGALENAFHAFGGVPRTIVVDNLKAAVIKADWFDPELNPKIIDFCRYYSTTILPTKPRTPRHKGKVERGVGYVQGNALKGRVFESLAKQNEFLQHWESSVADTRIHGTTKRQVGKLFHDAERAALHPLPRDRFPNYRESQRTVGRDGHIELAKSFYSMPPEYVTHEVWARWDSHVVRVYNQNFAQIAIHARVEPGKYSTNPSHIASEKINSVERGTAYLLGKVRYIGPHAVRWADAMMIERGIAGTRVLQGLLSLARRYSSSQIELACDAAWRHRTFRLQSVRHLIDRQGPQQQLMEFMEEHPLIRSPHEYAEFVHNIIQGGS